MVTLLIARRIEERTRPIKRSTSLEGKDGQVVGTSILGSTQSHASQVRVILDDAVLYGITFIKDVLEHLVRRLARLVVDISCRHLRVDDRHTTILANEIEIEVSTPEAGLPLIVFITVHLLLIVGVELEILELQVLEILQYHIAGLDALIHFAPERTLGVGWAPAAVIEGLDAGTAHGVNTLVGGRGKHASTKVLTIIIVCIIVDIGHETTHLLKGLNHIILILDYRLAVIHLIAARCQRQESEQTIY